MIEDDFYGWLKKLKAGDKAVITNGYELRIVTIDRTTPSGLLVIGNEKWDQRGRCRGASSWSREMLLEPTTENLEKAETQTISGALRAIKWEKLPLGTLRKIKALVPDAGRER